MFMSGVHGAARGFAPLSPSTWRVPSVDFVGWLRSSVAVADFVVLKVDIEGGEHTLLPALLRANATGLVDMLLWECHYGVPKLNGVVSSCWRLRDRLRKAGLRVHHEPPNCPRNNRDRARASASRAGENRAYSNWDCFRFE